MPPYLRRNHMSYKVLARKWRPQHFRDMLGQEPVLRALINALDSNRLHHAYLFTGMRGVGKTTIARIFAKCLNCLERGVSSDPCGQCSACQDIEAGRFFDLIEVDAASRTKVESTRELLENVPYAPASGRYKVYLIDEVHMFSTHSFNALLKTLEEPPEHVKFILATTDPQKVPATVLSRCLQFNLKRMPQSQLTQYLSKLLVEESIEHEMPALDLIARASEGSVRDALSLVEQAAATGEGAVRATEVESMLGRASVVRLLQLINTLVAGNMPAVFEQVNQLAEYAPDFSELLGELLSLLHKVAVLQRVPQGVSDTEPGFDQLQQLASGMDAETLQLFYQIGLHARRDMAYAPDPRDAFDMTLLRMNAFKPQATGQMIGGATNALEGAADVQVGAALASASAGGGGGSVQTSTAGTASDGVVSTQQAQSVASGGIPVRGEVSAGGALRAAALAAARGESVPDVAVTPADCPPAAPAQPLAADELPVAKNTPPVKVEAAQEGLSAAENQVHTQNPLEPAAQQSDIDNQPVIDKTNIVAGDWPSIVQLLDIAGMPLELANNTAWLGLQGDTVSLALEAASEHLNTARFVERLTAAMSDWFGHPIKLSLESVEQTLQTPARLAEQQRLQLLAAAQDAIKLDPMVKQLIERVDGAVDESSIQPLGGS